MWKMKAQEERDKRLAEIEDRRTMMKIDADDRRQERKITAEKEEGTVVAAGSDLVVGGEVVHSTPSTTNKLDPETKAQVDLYKNITTTLSKGGEFSMETTVTKQLEKERAALSEILRSKGVLPETAATDAPPTPTSDRVIQQGEFEPAEADWVSDTLGARYGADEIKNMVKEAEASVAIGRYKTRGELAKAYGDTIPVEVVAQILDAVFPQENGLLNTEQPLNTPPTQPKSAGVVDPFK